MIRQYLLVLFLTISVFAHGQNNVSLDSLRNAYSVATNDSSRIEILSKIFYIYIDTDNDSSFAYGQKFYQLSLSTKYPILKVRGFRALGVALSRRANQPMALELYFKALHILEALDSTRFKSVIYVDIGNAYNSQNDGPRAIEYYLKALQTAAPVGIITFNDVAQSRALMNLSSIYLNAGKLDSALYYGQHSYEIGVKANFKKYLPATIKVLGDIQKKSGNTSLAMEYYRLSVKDALAYNNMTSLSENLLAMANLFDINKQTDSVYKYASKSFAVAKQINNIYAIESSSTVLNQVFKRQQKPDSSNKYLEIMLSSKDSLLNKEKIQQVQNLSFNEELRQQEVEKSRLVALEERKKNLQLIGIAAFIVSFIIGFMLLSRKSTSLKAVSFLGIVGLLLVFEFIALLTHPWIERVTHHSPVLSLLLLVLLASVLVPAHHYFEKLIKEKLIHRETKSQVIISKGEEQKDIAETQ